MTTSRRIQETDSQVVARQRPYSDIDLGYKILGDIRPIRDVTAIRNAVKNILLTGKNEKPFMPDFGSNISKYLFEQPSVSIIVSISNEIERVLKKYEPRIKVTNIDVYDNTDSNSYSVDIDFIIVGNTESTNLQFYLERVR